MTQLQLKNVIYQRIKHIGKSFVGMPNNEITRVKLNARITYDPVIKRCKQHFTVYENDIIPSRIEIK